LLTLALLLAVALAFVFGSLRLFALALTAFIASFYPAVVVLLAVAGIVGGAVYYVYWR
jgi:hypothetical protein